MTAEPGVRFGIANCLLVLVLIAAWAARLGATGTAWAAVIAAGALGIGLSRTMTAGLAIITWAWFTGFVENRYGQLTFAGDDVRRLLLFTVATLILSVLARRLRLVITEYPRG